MTQPDFFGGGEVEAPFRDIGNTRDSTAEQKAMLVLRINRAAASVPPKVLNGSIQATRTWVLHRAAGAEAGGRQESLGGRFCSALEQPGAVALIPRALGRLKTGQRNRTEAAYEAVLELRKHAGEVLGIASRP
jgi:hypothetical protein